MQGKSAAAGNNWIPAIGVSGGVFGAEDAQVHQQVQRLLHSFSGQVFVRPKWLGASGHRTRAWPSIPVPVSRWEEAGDG